MISSVLMMKIKDFYLFSDQKLTEMGETFIKPCIRRIHQECLKGHGNEADFLGFLQKSVRHRFLTLHFEPFRFELRIRGDIRNRKTTPRLA
jgi:hypothetical protein